MSGISIIDIGPVAMCKMVLHAARYSHLAVNGILLGPSSVGGGKDSSDVHITEAVPLFHHTLALAPMLDVALTQIEERYSSKGLEIVGYYQANENVRDVEPDFIATKITEKIADNCHSACLVMIDNRAISLSLQTAPVIVSQLTHDGKWKTKDRSSVYFHCSSLRMTSDLLQRHVHHEITDFDQHFDDITCDWANTRINALVRSFDAA